MVIEFYENYIVLLGKIIYFFYLEVWIGGMEYLCFMEGCYYFGSFVF